MSVRTAELLMGICTLLLSFGLMYNVISNDLTIGWLEGRGPGAGMWPFWLSAGMALASLWTIIRWFRGTTPESRNENPYIDPETVFIVGITVSAIFGLLLLTSVIGLYFSMMLFLLFYVKGIGRHKWPITLTVVFAMPVAIYMLFEVALNKYLPRGLPFFENIFLHIDDFRYSIMS
ncbi:tripartite tricarboxylate transporter TctB family protein [Marivita sp. S0852]|uniref:tripartite tricarboxylate transporter TctB family protein n=1 Tax=Marivita sp. S0852 TaxID=3373893 RepID=UPI003981CBF9